jgi:hypothetical protein
LAITAGPTTVLNGLIYLPQAAPDFATVATPLLL